MSTSESDIVAVAAVAKAQGIDTIERVTAHLEQIIERHKQYLEYRERKKRQGAYDEIVKQDQMVIAMAIVLLESLSGNEPL